MSTDTSRSDGLRRVVREHYGAIAEDGGGGCGPSSSDACCGGDSPSATMGYDRDDLAKLPEGADLGLGCGNPGAIAELRAGETVVDLGSGAGIDCFLAAERVGPGGRVIGVDMTPGMIERARENARRAGAANVEFRLGEIESLPVADASVDVVLSNCVVNLSPEKARVYAEVFRVLKPGGRVAISDVVAVAEVPEEVRNDPRRYAGCVSGAERPERIERLLRAAGFENVAIEIVGSAPDGAGFVRSATVRGVRPA